MFNTLVWQISNVKNIFFLNIHAQNIIIGRANEVSCVILKYGNVYYNYLTLKIQGIDFTAD